MDEIILKYLQGVANEDEKRQLLEWLQADDENKKQFCAIRDVWLISGKGNRFTHRYKEKAFDRFIRDVEKLEKRRIRPQKYTFVRIAAAIALLIATTGIGYYAGNRNTAQDTAVQYIVNNSFLMGADSKGSITLPDGTVAWLHGNSRLSYPEKFASEARNVKVSGEAYFDVTENPEIPFVVETDNMHIKVLGTTFNIKDYDNQATTEAVLVSGKVEAYIPESNQHIVMEPNQKLLWNEESGSYDLATVEAADYVLWINDRLVFTNEKLRNIFFKMERWYNIKIQCDPKVDLNQRLTFTIRREDKEEILKLLHIIAPIKYRINNENITISPK